jgi:hypothetical protein
MALLWIYIEWLTSRRLSSIAIPDEEPSVRQWQKLSARKPWNLVHLLPGEAIHLSNPRAREIRSFIYLQRRSSE